MTGVASDDEGTPATARADYAGLRRLIAAVVTVGVLVLCWLPSSAAHHVPLHGTDKLLHAAAFFAIALAWRFAGLRTWPVLLLGLVLAVTTELGQWVLASGRTGDAKDVVADMAGLLAGLACVHLGASMRPGARPD